MATNSNIINRIINRADPIKGELKSSINQVAPSTNKPNNTSNLTSNVSRATASTPTQNKSNIGSRRGGGSSGVSSPSENTVVQLNNNTGLAKGGLVSSSPFRPLAPSSSSSSGGGSQLPNPAGNQGYNPANDTLVESNTGGVVSAPPLTSGVEPPERYERGVGSAIGESIKNVFNFGVIGTEGFGAYTKQAFYTPFEYVGKPKAYDTMPAPKWRGTEFGFGMSVDQKKAFTPVDYGSKTFFDVSKAMTIQAYDKYDVPYKNEPANLLPLRLAEKTESDIRPKYEQQLTNDLTGVTDEAKRTAIIEKANKEFYTEYANTYSTRSIGLNEDVARIEGFNAKIFEPKAYGYIRTTGNIIEATTLTLGTIYGGSLVTLGISGYLGVKTFADAKTYSENYKDMTPSQKALGFGTIALEGAGAFFTFTGGLSKFYGEWRNIIYDDLMNTPGRITGRAVTGLEDNGVRYALRTERVMGKTANANTFTSLDVTPTGDNSVGYYAKGFTKTKIFDPETEKYIFRTTKFTSSGSIPNIEVMPLTANYGGISVTSGEASAGLGKGIYYPTGNDKFIKFKFTASSTDMPNTNSFSVLGGKPTSYKPTIAINEFGVGRMKYGIKSSLDTYGSISKLPIKSDVEFINNAGGMGNSLGFDTGFSTTETSSGSLKLVSSTASLAKTELAGGVGNSLQSIGIKNIASSEKITASTTSFLAPSAGISKSGYSPKSLTSQELGVKTDVLPALQFKEILDTKQSEKTALGFSSGQAIIDINVQRDQVIPSLALAQPQALKTEQSLKSGLGFAMPFGFGGDFLPEPLNLGGGFAMPFLKPDFDFDILNSRGFGARKRSKYTPSYEAFIFDIKGKAPKGLETGARVRPITKGFKLEFGKIEL